MPGERPDPFDDRVDHPLSAAPALQASQQHIAGVALDQRRDRRLVIGAHQQVTLPMAGHRAILNLGRPLRDRDHVDHPPPPLPRGALAPSSPPRTQIAFELAAQLPTGLHEQRLVDRLRADPHLHLVRMIDPQPSRDLLRRPTSHQPRWTASNNRGHRSSFRSFGRRAARSARRSARNARYSHRRRHDRLISRPIVDRAPPQRPSDPRVRLPRRDPNHDPLPLLKRQPMRRMLNSPTHQQPLLPNPHRRPQRDTHLTRNHPSPLTRQQPRRHHPTLHRTQPILTTNPNTHKPSNRREHPSVASPRIPHVGHARSATVHSNRVEWQVMHDLRAASRRQPSPGPSPGARRSKDPICPDRRESRPPGRAWMPGRLGPMDVERAEFG